MSGTTSIRKEQLSEQQFTKLEINRNESENRALFRQLHLAMLLGNNFQNKVKIVFSTIEGLKEVFTTVWATTDKFVVLKCGTFIPVSAIISVDLN